VNFGLVIVITFRNEFYSIPDHDPEVCDSNPGNTLDCNKADHTM
jgi:hypothetical protein